MTYNYIKGGAKSSSVINEQQNLDLDWILQQRAVDTPEKVALRFLKDGEDDIVDLTYRQLNERAARLANCLYQKLKPGARVLLVLEPSLNYMIALFAIFKVGATAVPSFPPVGTRAIERFACIQKDCEAQLVIAESSLQRAVERVNLALSPEVKIPEWLFIDSDFFYDADGVSETPVIVEWAPNNSEQTVLLQYTSGSTGNPKGVMISVSNLISNSRVLDSRLGAEQHVGFTWLPPYHDMGLMGALLLSVYSGFMLVMMTPKHFIQQPLRWLKGLSKHKVTVTVSPNFALDLCVSTISDEEASKLDLSSLRLLFCGAEPVRKMTLDLFAKKFAVAGFSSSAYVPCYGLAEATLFISGKSDNSTTPKTLEFDSESLTSGFACPAKVGKPATTMVSCGTVADNHTVLVVDPETKQTLPLGAVGEIWFKGASVAQGYLNKPKLSEEVFFAYLAGNPKDGPYLRTGDLGFILEDELYITGRIKDLIIFAGRNLYPQDIEEVVQACHSAIRPNGVAAFSVDINGIEHLVVVAEIVRSFKQTVESLENIRDVITAAVAHSYGIRPYTVHLAPVSTIPLTTSGKVRRSACREAFKAGTLSYANKLLGQ